MTGNNNFRNRDHNDNYTPDFDHTYYEQSSIPISTPKSEMRTYRKNLTPESDNIPFTKGSTTDQYSVQSFKNNFKEQIRQYPGESNYASTNTQNGGNINLKSYQTYQDNVPRKTESIGSSDVQYKKNKYSENIETTFSSINSNNNRLTKQIPTRAPRYNQNENGQSNFQKFSKTKNSLAQSRTTSLPVFDTSLSYNKKNTYETEQSSRNIKTRTTKSSFKNKYTSENSIRDSTYWQTEKASNSNVNQYLNDKTTENSFSNKATTTAQKRISQSKYEEYMIKLFGDNDSDDDNIKLNTRHLDGREIVAPGEYPHMAAIGFLTSNKTIDWKCGGSLISDYFIITAAHCCDFSGQKPSHVKMGDINLKVKNRNTQPQNILIKKIYKYPLYNDDSYYNDIALIKLSIPAVFTNFVRPIRLWDKSLIPYDTVYAMGYGATSFGKSITNILTDLNLTIVENSECNQNLPKIPETNVGIIESQMCAIDKFGNRDTCQGDSGGPLQLNLVGKKRLRYHLVGITSFGVLCGGDHPSVYTRISSFIDWIEEIVWSG